MWLDDIREIGRILLVVTALFYGSVLYQEAVSNIDNTVFAPEDFRQLRSEIVAQRKHTRNLQEILDKNYSTFLRRQIHRRLISSQYICYSLVDEYNSRTSTTDPDFLRAEQLLSRISKSSCDHDGL